MNAMAGRSRGYRRDLTDGNEADVRGHLSQQEQPQVPLEFSSGLLQVLATEHWSLLSTRSITYTETFSRVTMFLSILSGAVIALALLAQVDHFHEIFLLAGALILSVVVFSGIVTVARLAQLNREDLRWVAGMNRLRHAYLELHPSLGPYFVAGTSDDVRGLALTVGVPFHERGLSVLNLRDLPAILTVIVAAAAGVLAALVALLLGAPGVLAIVVAAGVFLAMKVGMWSLSSRALFAFVRKMPSRFPSPDHSLD